MRDKLNMLSRYLSYFRSFGTTLHVTDQLFSHNCKASLLTPFLLVEVIGSNSVLTKAVAGDIIHKQLSDLEI